MEARPLALALTVGTSVAWGALAVTSPKAAIQPLLGFVPLSTWEVFQEGPASQLFLPLSAFVCLASVAWLRRSKMLAWCIPAAPLLGIVLFWVQFGMGMALAFT